MEDYSVQVSHLNRNEIVKKLGSLAPVGHNTEALRISLAKKYKDDHPIHRRLKMLSNQRLFDLRRNMIQTSFKKDVKRVLKVMANHFFETFPDAPLTSLDRILEEDAYFAELTSIVSSIFNKYFMRKHISTTLFF